MFFDLLYNNNLINPINVLGNSEYLVDDKQLFRNSNNYKKRKEFRKDLV